MGFRAAACAVLLYGCARFGFELLDTGDLGPLGRPDAGGGNLGFLDGIDAGGENLGGTGGTAAGNGGSAGAGQVDPTACVAYGPFSAPQAVPGVNQNALRPTLSADALTLLYAAGEPADLFVATRADRSTSFGAASALPGP